jgi:hypothetical protein
VDQFMEDRDLRSRTVLEEWEQGRWWDRAGIVLTLVLLGASVIIVAWGLVSGRYP